MLIPASDKLESTHTQLQKQYPKQLSIIFKFFKERMDTCKKISQKQVSVISNFLKGWTSPSLIP